MLIEPQIKRSTLPEHLARQVRIELRKIPTWQLREGLEKLKGDEPTDTAIIEQNRAHALNAIEEILWERGKLQQAKPSPTRKPESISEPA